MTTTSCSLLTATLSLLLTTILCLPLATTMAIIALIAVIVAAFVAVVVGGDVLNAIVSALTWVGDLFVQAFQWFLDSGFQALIAVVIDMVYPFIMQAVQWLLDNGVQALRDLILDIALPAIRTTLSSSWGAILENIVSAASRVANEILPLLSESLPALSEVVNSLSQGALNLGAQGILEPIVSAINMLGPVVQSLVQYVGGAILSTPTALSSNAINQALAFVYNNLFPLMQSAPAFISEALRAISEAFLWLTNQGLAQVALFLINAIVPAVEFGANVLIGMVIPLLVQSALNIAVNMLPILYPIVDYALYILLNVGALLIVFLHPQFTIQAADVLGVAVLAPIIQYLIPAIMAIFAPILPIFSKRLNYSGAEAGIALNLGGKQLRKKADKIVSAIQWFENPENPSGFHALTRAIRLTGRKPSPTTIDTPRRGDVAHRLPRIYAPMGGNIPTYPAIGGTL